MTLAADEGGRLVAALAAEPGFADLAEPDTAVLLWRAGAEAPVWTSPAGREFLSGLARRPDGLPRIPAATRERLDALAKGQAPRAGLRLERLNWGGTGAPLTFACRLVSFEGGDLLLAALPRPGRPARARPAPAAASSAPATAVPPAHDAPRPGPATVILPAPRGIRFMWRGDGEGRFTFVSDELVDLVGLRGADVVSLGWGELTGRLVDDPGGAVASAWARGEGWKRLVVHWRDPDRERLVPVELTGAPVPGGAGERVAFRGFGLAFPARARAVAPGEFRDMPPRHVAVQDTHSAEEAAQPDADGATAELPEGGETVFNMLRAWFVSGEGGAAHPGAAPAAEEGPRPLAPPESAGALSSLERGALHEIARTLQGPSEGPVDRPSAEIVPLPRPRLRAAPTALLDQLPVGCVVMRDDAPLFASRSLLEELGFASLPEAVGRGALQNLGKVAPDSRSIGVVSLSDAKGELHPFQLRISRVDWGERAADLILLTPPPEAPPAEIEALRLDLAARDARLDEARAALDLAADAVVMLDSSARLLSLTRSAERLFGIGANEVVGDSVTALIEPRDHRAVLASLDVLRSSPANTVQQSEIRGRTRGGVGLPLSMRAGHAPGPQGGFCLAFNDVSHFQRLERELREAQATAEEASANRADFLARISHEVRTPLTAITGFAELMLEERFGTLGNERYKGYIRDIRDSGVHVISLVNDLLDLAKATSGAEDLHPEPLDLNTVVQQCVALASPLAGQEKTIVRTSFPANLPRVLADERSIRQITINLLSNAIRFTGAGGQVIVSTALGGPGEVVLSVRDTGPGMSDAEVETALTPFRQVQNTRRRDGTGLGLPLSKALTEANGGVFVVTSARDLGTLIEVRLPVADHEAVAAE